MPRIHSYHLRYLGEEGDSTVQFCRCQPFFVVVPNLRRLRTKFADPGIPTSERPHEILEMVIQKPILKEVKSTRFYWVRLDVRRV